MGRALTMLFALIVTTVLFTCASSTTGVCYSRRSRSEAQHHSRVTSFSYTYKCGWWYAYRCRATRYRTEYFTNYAVGYYSRKVCCSGYTDYAGACRRVDIGFEQSSYSVGEDAGQIDVCATIQHAVEMESRRDFTVEFRTSSGSALENSDFRPVTAYRRSLSNGRGRVCVSIPIVYDYRYEGSETFYVYLSGQSLPSYAHLVRTSTTVRIYNTMRMQIGFEQRSQVVDEDVGSASVCLGIRQPSGRSDPIRNTDYSVIFETRAVNAQAPHDFRMVRQEVTLNTMSRRQCVDVPIVHDTLHEETEIFEATLIQHSLPSHVTISPNIITISIINTHRIVIGFMRTLHSVAEDAGNVTECVILTHGDTSSSIMGFGVDVNAIATNSATSPEDFIFNPTRLNLSSGSPQQCFNVTIMRDSLDEPSEFFNVTLNRSIAMLASSVLLSPANMTIRIDNRHSVEIGFERSSYNVSEDAGAVTVCAAVAHQADMESGRSLSVTFSTASGTAREGSDFTSLATTQNFTLSRRLLCVNISVIYDYIYEWSESFTVHLTGPNLPSYVHFTHSGATVQIHNVYRAEIEFERATYYVDEDAGAVTVCAALQNVQNMESGRSFAVTFRTDSGSAQEGSDFTSFTAEGNFSHSISRLCFNININYDYLFESTENFTVNLAGEDLPSYTSLTRPSTTVHIRNSYKMEIGFEQASQTVREDVGSASVCVRILNPRQGTIASITYGLTFKTHQNGAPNGALPSHDFHQVTRPVTLSSGTRRQCVSVPIIHDHDHETTETFTATLTRQSSLPSYVTINPSTTTIEILNTRRTAIGFEHTSLSVAEDAGSISACVRLLHLSSSDSGRTFQVLMATVTGTAANSALSPSDFMFSPTTVSLSSQSRRRCCSITIMNDIIYELPEYFTVTLNRTSSLANSALLSPDTLSIRIDNRHRVTIGFEKTSYEVNEDAGSVTVCVRITLNDGESISSLLESHLYRMDIRTRENNATASEDFFHGSATVTLSSSSPRACIAVPIIYDAVFEGTESFSVTLHVNAVPGYVNMQPQSTVVNIRHVHGMLIGFEKTRLFALESSSNIGVCVQVTFPINPFAPIPNLNYSVVMTTQSGTGPNGAQGDRDFQQLSSVITLTPTVRLQCTSVRILPDNVREIPEMFTIHLSRSGSLPSHVGLSPNTATVTIYDP